MDQGAEKIEDADELARVRLQARKINIQMVIYGALLTAIFVVIPLLV